MWLWLNQTVRRAVKVEPVRRWWAEARAYASKYAGLVADWTGSSHVEQMRQMAWLALRHGVSPKAYYSYKLYRPNRFEKAGRYLYHEPKVRLNNFLLNRTRDRVSFDMGDKRSWFAWAQNHDIPTPHPIVSFDEGTVQDWWDERSPKGLPETDLFSIWVDVYRGEGAQVWSFEDGRYTDIQDPSVCLTENGLITHLSEKSTERPVVCMERIYNHPKWQKFTSGGLATCRLVTGRLPGGEPKAITAKLKMPRNGSIVDSMPAGGLAAPIDLRDGTLGATVSKYPEAIGDHIHVHPDTGAKVVDRVLPRWPSIVELAISTHRKIPNAPFVGWDVTLTREGPSIVEPNDGWGAGGQISGGVPLPDTIYQKMYDSWANNIKDNP